MKIPVTSAAGQVYRERATLAPDPACIRAISAHVRKVHDARASRARPARSAGKCDPAPSPCRYPLRSRLRQVRNRERAADVARALGFQRAGGVVDVPAYWGHLCAVAACAGNQVRLEQLIAMTPVGVQAALPVRVDGTDAGPSSPRPPQPPQRATAPQATSPEAAATDVFGLASGRWDCLRW